MKAYIIRRLLLMIPVLLGVSLGAFMLIRLIPGDACEVMLRHSPTGSAEELEKCRADNGLDQPLYTAYPRWLGDIVRGDFGRSIWTKRSIGEELKKRIPITVELAGLSIIFSTTFGLAIGIVSATRQGSVVDYAGRMFAIIGLSIPNFVLGTMVLMLLIIQFEWIPPITYKRFTDSPWENFQQFIFPSVLLGFGLAASIARMTRSTMLEVLRQDYIRTAWSKGLRERSVIFRHALRNALIPVITIIGLQFGYLMGGSVVMEILFGMPGLGKTMVDTIFQRDYPFLQSLVLVTSAAYVFVNLLVDLSYGLLDPRIRYS